MNNTPQCAIEISPGRRLCDPPPTIDASELV